MAVTRVVDMGNPLWLMVGSMLQDPVSAEPAVSRAVYTVGPTVTAPSQYLILNFEPQSYLSFGGCVLSQYFLQLPAPTPPTTPTRPILPRSDLAWVHK